MTTTMFGAFAVAKNLDQAHRIYNERFYSRARYRVYKSEIDPCKRMTTIVTGLEYKEALAVRDRLQAEEDKNRPDRVGRMSRTLFQYELDNPEAVRNLFSVEEQDTLLKIEDRVKPVEASNADGDDCLS